MFRYEPSDWTLFLDVDPRRHGGFDALFLHPVFGPKLIHEMTHFYQCALTVLGHDITELNWLMHNTMRECLTVCAWIPGYENGGLFEALRAKSSKLPEELLRLVQQMNLNNQTLSYIYGDEPSQNIRGFEATGHDETVAGYQITPGTLKVVLDVESKPRCIRLRDRHTKEEILSGWHLFETMARILEEGERGPSPSEFGRRWQAIASQTTCSPELIAYQAFEKWSESDSPDVFMVCAEAALQGGGTTKHLHPFQCGTNAGVRLYDLAEGIVREGGIRALNGIDEGVDLYRRCLRFLGHQPTDLDQKALEYFSGIYSFTGLEHPLSQYLRRLLELRAAEAGTPFFLGCAGQSDNAGRIVSGIAREELLPIVRFGSHLVLHTKHLQRLVEFSEIRNAVARLFLHGVYECNVHKEFSFACDGDCSRGLNECACFIGNAVRRVTPSGLKIAQCPTTNGEQFPKIEVNVQAEHRAFAEKTPLPRGFCHKIWALHDHHRSPHRKPSASVIEQQSTLPQQRAQRADGG